MTRSAAGDAELNRVADLWRQAILKKDVALASTLRAADYTATLPGGRVLDREQDLALIAKPPYEIAVTRFENASVARRSDEATLTFETVIETGAKPLRFATAVEWRQSNGEWLAITSRTTTKHTRSVRTLVPQWLRPRRHRTSSRQLDYIPYKGDEDFFLPRTVPNDPDLRDLPIPPPELWLGYAYLPTGKLHVDKMLEILAASDFEFRPRDRILDFGCGAGRMIRRLQHLADTCEIWGTDISAEHITWSKRHLSPPFHFATTTRTPHLPFEDRSFRFIYCGSVFTHIEDLTEAWLLELHRILEPDGRLYVTIHDNRTIEMMENGSAEWLQWITQRRVYQEAKGSFDMLVVGRDQDSQVFYDRDYFCRILSNTFEVLSITPEAYHYQTAILARRPPARR